MSGVRIVSLSYPIFLKPSPLTKRVVVFCSFAIVASFTPTYPPSDPDCWWTYRQCDTPSNTEIPADVIEMPEPSTYGIGFDDGPNCSHNAFYQHLKDREIKATM